MRRARPGRSGSGRREGGRASRTRQGDRLGRAEEPPNRHRDPIGGGGGLHRRRDRPRHLARRLPRGGTLRVLMPDEPFAHLDPQQQYQYPAWGLFRCCLLRTLLSYNGRDSAHGGARVRPDLATSMPQISEDGLTWTFHIKLNIRYAPPLQHTEVTAHDFVRALEREGDRQVGGGKIPGYGFYYSVISGFDAYAAGEADSISGIQTPDDHTISVTLVRPTGDLGYLLAMPATAPIPPSPADPDARLGTATGHDDGYGRYLVSTGPYMIAGSGNLDFSLAPEDQEPLAGYVPATFDPDTEELSKAGSITLVHNPSWDRRSDSLRGAYVDRIQITIGGSGARDAHAVDSGQADMVFSDQTDPLPLVRRYLGAPALRGRVRAVSLDAIAPINFNLAEPPFDDPHVRRAVNYAIDKQGFLQLIQAPGAFRPPARARWQRTSRPTRWRATCSSTPTRTPRPATTGTREPPVGRWPNLDTTTTTTAYATQPCANRCSPPTLTRSSPSQRLGSSPTISARSGSFFESRAWVCSTSTTP